MRLGHFKQLALALLLSCSVSYAQISFGGLNINQVAPDSASVQYEELSYNEIALSKTEQTVRIGKGEFTQFALSFYSKKDGEVFIGHQPSPKVEVDYPSVVEVLVGKPARLVVYINNLDVAGTERVRFTVYSTPFRDEASYLEEFYVTVENPYSERITQSTRLTTNNSYFGNTYTLGHNIKYKQLNMNFGVNHLVRNPALNLYNNYDTQTSISVGVTYNWPAVTLEQPLEETIKQQYYFLQNNIRDLKGGINEDHTKR